MTSIFLNFLTHVRQLLWMKFNTENFAWPYRILTDSRKWSFGRRATVDWSNFFSKSSFLWWDWVTANMILFFQKFFQKLLIIDFISLYFYKYYSQPNYCSFLLMFTEVKAHKYWFLLNYIFWLNHKCLLCNIIITMLIHTKREVTTRWICREPRPVCLFTGKKNQSKVRDIQKQKTFNL